MSFWFDERRFEKVKELHEINAREPSSRPPSAPGSPARPPPAAAAPPAAATGHGAPAPMEQQGSAETLIPDAAAPSMPAPAISRKARKARVRVVSHSAADEKEFDLEEAIGDVPTPGRDASPTKPNLRAAASPVKKPISGSRGSE
ncbi:hypothetical protein DFJ74DRAFT_700477 [Hyaloraphidium curvatum]|nr:hypothetical protein DFJ74DRAFT_700477 [Hyaloraphidium curvatum]